MSEIRANSITDAAGTGAPNFPNGMSGSGASLTSLPAGQLTGALPAISGAALTNLPAPTTAQVLDATAGATAGAVGTYAILRRSAANVSWSLGDNIAGSNFAASTVSANGNLTTSSILAGNSGYSPSGTWKALSAQFATAGYYPYGLFLRIS
jgi:hypothetical protein